MTQANPVVERYMESFATALKAFDCAEHGEIVRDLRGHIDEALGTGKQIDVVLNGYELTPARAADMEHTQPYYVGWLGLMARRDGSRVTSWSDLDAAPADGRKLKIGVLQASGAHHYLSDH